MAGPIQRVATDDIVVNVPNVGRIIIAKGSTYTIGEDGGAYFGHKTDPPAAPPYVQIDPTYPAGTLDVPEPPETP